MMFEKLRGHKHVIAHWAMELLIVVAGVLIALGAQQWAQDRASKQGAARAEARIREELATNVLLGVERITLNNCIKQRLSRLANELTASRREWSDFHVPEDKVGQTAFREIYRVPSRVWVSTEYNGSLSNGHLASLAPERATQLAGTWLSNERQGDKRTSPILVEAPFRSASKIWLLRSAASNCRIRSKAYPISHYFNDGRCKVTPLKSAPLPVADVALSLRR
jgi:hypothetical protein